MGERGYFHSVALHPDGTGEDSWGIPPLNDIALRYGVAEFVTDQDEHHAVVQRIKQNTPDIYVDRYHDAISLLREHTGRWSSGRSRRIKRVRVKAFDQIALTVQRTVITTLNLAVRAWRNDGLGSTCANAFDKGVRVIALVGDDRLAAQSVDQILRARNIGHLSFGKNQSQRATTRIHSQMNLGAQSSARSPERLGSVFFRAPAECWCARMTVQSISTCSSSPACASTRATRSQTPLRRHREADVCRMPSSELLGQITPRTARARDPQHGLDEQPIVCAMPAHITRLARNNALQKFPYLIGRQHSTHLDRLHKR